MVLFYLMLPQQIELDWDWQKTLVAAAQQDWLWLEHLTNAFYALVLIAWEPIYVACGFSLYLNRRTELEAWDLELVFRRLRQRLSSVAALLLLVGLTLVPLHQDVWAAAEVDPSTHLRLRNQALNSQASKDGIQAILEKPPFKNPESVTRYRFGDEPKPGTQSGKPPSWLKKLLGNLDGGTFASIAKGLEVFLWAVVLGTIALVIWRYREWLQAFVSRRPQPRKKSRGPSRPSCSGWMSPAKPCPKTSPPVPHSCGRASPGKPWACCTGPCSTACCMTTSCHSRPPTLKARSWNGSGACSNRPCWRSAAA